jgi:hypothetical protein
MRVVNGEWQIKTTSRGAGVSQGSRAGSASYESAHLARASIGKAHREGGLQRGATCAAPYGVFIAASLKKATTSRGVSPA